MFYDSMDYRSKIDKIMNCDVDHDIASELGRYYELYNSDIRNAITAVTENDNMQFYGLNPYKTRTPEGLIISLPSPSASEILFSKTEWRDNPVLICSQNASSENYPGHCTWVFRNFIDRYTVSSVSDIIHLYDIICKYLYQYITEKRELRATYDIITVTRFLLYDVFRTALNACDVFYKATVPEEEYKLSCKPLCDYIKKLFDLLVRRCNNEEKYLDMIAEFSYVITSFYNNFNLNKSYLHMDKDGVDPFVLFFINSTLCYEDEKNDSLFDKRRMELIKKLKSYSTGNFGENNPLKNSNPYKESTSDVVGIDTDKSFGLSNSDITIFGDKDFSSLFGNEFKLNCLKMDLLRFNSDMVRNYLGKEENVKVDFLIDEQLKMYLQAEMNCKMLVANVKRENEANMLTILQYENDNFVLFKLSDDFDTIYGLSLNEDTETNERKLISIDRDEDLSFQFVTNFDEI